MELHCSERKTKSFPDGPNDSTQPSINEEAINRLPQVEINLSLADLPTLEETKKSISLLSSGKAPGADTIPAETYKVGGPRLVEKLTDLFQPLWRQEAVPQQIRANHLYKRKGNHQAYYNHRGISLLSIAGKILVQEDSSCLKEHLDQDLLPESQCGFRQNCGTTDMMFTARQTLTCTSLFST